MKVVFMGTPDFAVTSLKAIVENGFDVSAVVTVPDRPTGRGYDLTPSPVKVYAVQQGLTVLQPEKLRSPEFAAQLQAIQPDVIVVVAFRMLPEVVWQMPRWGTFNLHASLLPQYRGAAPINWAVINGETETGVTTFFIDKEIDTGKIIFTEKTPIGERETAGQLHDRLMNIGARLVVKTLHAISAKSVVTTPQQQLQQGVTLKSAPKIFKETCLIDWQQSGTHIYNLVRGLSPYPAAYTELKNTDSNQVLNLKIFETAYHPIQHNLSAGTLISDGKNEIKIAVNDGFISILQLQLAGKKAMNVQQFLNGFDVTKWVVVFSENKK